MIGLSHREVRRRPGEGRAVARGAPRDAPDGRVRQAPGRVLPDAVEVADLNCVFYRFDRSVALP